MKRDRKKMIESLRALKDEDIDTSDIPILDEKFATFLGVIRPKAAKRAVTLRLDESMVQWFKSMGGSYTGNMRDVLFAYMLAEESRKTI